MKATVRDGSMSFPQWGVDNPNRMLKKSSSGVLSSFRPSTYPRGYALYLGIVVHETDGM
jgi:hypothetical protein